MPTASTPLASDQHLAAVRARYDSIAQADLAHLLPECCRGDAQAAGPAVLGAYSAMLGYDAPQLAAAPEGANLGLGCGNPLALASIRPGETVLDLGSGGGFDCFLAAQQLAGTGRVIGVDMTPSMVSKARQNLARQSWTNVEFRLGEIEALPVADATVDLIISNCVINLSPDQPAVFREAFRVLRPGGRLAISDVVALQPLPEAWREQLDQLTGCISGAQQASQLVRWLEEAGFREVRVTPRPESRAFIEHWLPGQNVADFITSAVIEARKP